MTNTQVVGVQAARSHTSSRHHLSNQSQFLTVIRVSERNATEIDFLSNHDSGDAEGDAGFMTAMGSGGKFIHDFNVSVISQYCLEFLPAQTGSHISNTDKNNDNNQNNNHNNNNHNNNNNNTMAQYVSCNPPDTQRLSQQAAATSTTPGISTFPNATQVCECVNEMDRRIGHQNASAACGPHPQPFAPCNCSAAGLALSAKFVGSMPVFLPWVCGQATSGDGTCDQNIPFGHWYSTPTEGQCSEGQPLGTNGCTWRRLPTASVLRGHQLIELGWNSTRPDWSDVSTEAQRQYHNNAQVLQAAFAAVNPDLCRQQQLVMAME